MQRCFLMGAQSEILKETENGAFSAQAAELYGSLRAMDEKVNGGMEYG
jgi:hypothetical protein